MSDELKAEWLDVVAQIEAVDEELFELCVRKQGQSMRAHDLRRRKTMLVRVKHEWEELINECS